MTGEHGELPGPPRTPFFTPERVRTLAARIGGAALLHRMDTAMRGFVAANPRLRIVEHLGPDALQDVYGTVVAGRALPENAHIVRPA